MKKKEEFMNKGVSVVILYPKGGGGVIYTCVKDDVVREKEQYKSIGLHGFDYKLFEEEEGTWGVERAQMCIHI